MRCSRGVCFSRGGQSIGENGKLGRSSENLRRAGPCARGPERRREIVTYEIPGRGSLGGLGGEKGRGGEVTAS
jgi:hypothetical protein